MTVSEARKLLSFHSGRTVSENSAHSAGFIESLRPFTGELCEYGFHEIMECLRTLKNDFSQPMLDRELMADLMAVIHLSSVWCSLPEMPMTAKQRDTVLNWSEMISCTLFMLLDGTDEQTAFEAYEDYCRTHE